MKILIVGLGLLVITGCASQPKGTWYKPGIDEHQTSVDEADCRLFCQSHGEPVYGTTGGQIILSSMLENNRENGMYNDCMTSKGYLFQKDTNVVTVSGKK